MIALSCALALGFALAFAAFAMKLRRTDVEAIAAARTKDLEARLAAVTDAVTAHTKDPGYHPKAADVADALRRVGNVELAGRGR